jgi:hypothetical protein
MDQQYLQELFSFQAVFQQFDDTYSCLLQMEPTEEGEKTLSGYDLHFKLKDGGFGVFASFVQHDDTGLLELKNQFSGDVKLSFAVFTNDPQFFDHAGLPYDPPGEYVYYLNNLNENERRTQLLVLDNSGLKETERVKLHTKQFSLEIVRDQQNKIVVPWVLDCRGNIIPETRYNWVIDEKQNTFSLDLSRLADGLYTIQDRITGSTTYYCTKASFIRRIPLLILEIFADPNLPEKYRIVKSINGIQYIDAKQFEIHFGDYLYYWKYTIIPVNIPSCSWIKLLTNNSNYTFLPDRAKIVNLDPIVFTSSQPINTPNDALKISLYRQAWTTDCRWSPPKYRDCNQDYWIEIANEYWCRYKDSYGNYKYKCPARCSDELIGLLPKPGEVYTKYYVEDGKQYAQMILYLVKENNQYIIKPTYEATGEYSYKIFGDQGDVTIQFINNVVVFNVTLHFNIPGKTGLHHIHMNRMGNLYCLDRIIRRKFPYFRIAKGDTMTYSFTYQLSNGQWVTSGTYSYVYND